MLGSRTLREVIWQPPPHQWIKCNIDGALTSNASAYAGLFRKNNADFICAFASNLNISSAFSVELCGFMTAVEIAAARGWNNLWIETDSELVVMAYKEVKSVPWSLSNRWYNFLSRTSIMHFIVSHIYREGNHNADDLAKIGLNLNRLTIWKDVPLEIRDKF
jgi:ribonuclease HI